jgi:hypothetical protein
MKVYTTGFGFMYDTQQRVLAKYFDGKELFVLPSVKKTFEKKKHSAK